MKGTQQPIICKWYRNFSDGKFQEIENINGPVYQPCYDDIGTKFIN